MNDKPLDRAMQNASIARPEEQGRQEPTDVGDLARATRTQLKAISHRSEQKERKALKSQAQRLKAALIIGHDGLKPGVLQTLNDLLRRDELVKVKVVGDRNVVSETAKTLAEKSGATLITVVGKAAVFYKARETNHDPI